MLKYCLIYCFDAMKLKSSLKLKHMLVFYKKWYSIIIMIVIYIINKCIFWIYLNTEIGELKIAVGKYIQKKHNYNWDCISL